MTQNFDAIIIGQTDVQGYHLATGFSGTGFKLSPAVGQCVSELILDGKASAVDISAFPPKRFERGEHLKGDDDYGVLWRNPAS